MQVLTIVTERTLTFNIFHASYKEIIRIICKLLQIGGQRKKGLLDVYLGKPDFTPQPHFQGTNWCSLLAKNTNVKTSRKWQRFMTIQVQMSYLDKT